MTSIMYDAIRMEADTNKPYFDLAATYKINRNSGKAMEVQNASTVNEANIQQYTDNGGTNQQWQIVKLP